MTRKVKPQYATIGTVSEGTLRTEDLISAFAGELEYYMKRLHLTRDQRKRFRELCRIANNEANEGLFDDGFVNGLEDALNEIAPPYCYFGTLEGDGACFGFWPLVDHDGLPKLNAGDDAPRDLWGEDVLLVNDHGNVTCGHVDKRGRFKAYWDAV